jgi:hypothetical protein
MKMLLTGMLIYIPSTLRAGIATLVCIIAIANLNYFEPHKNKILFWLTQISFITTAAKYIVALLLSVDTASQNIEEQTTISNLLITLDILFMSSSVIAMFASVWLLRTGIKKIQTMNDDADTDIGAAEHNNNATHIVPVSNINQQQTVVSDHTNNFITSYTLEEAAANALRPGHALRQSVDQNTQHNSQDAKHARNIHQHFQRHED